jgi:hypothetical protein
MTASARFGSNGISIRVGWGARPVSTAIGACSGVQIYLQACRRRACQGDYTLLTGAVLANIRQRLAPSVPSPRGVAKGESTARLARELDLSRKHPHMTRRHLLANLNHTPRPM